MKCHSVRQEPKNRPHRGCPPNKTIPVQQYQFSRRPSQPGRLKGLRTAHVGLLFCSWVGVAVLREYHGNANKVAGLDGLVELRDDGFRNFSEVFLHVYHD